jgi:hypothetical protein
MSILEILIRINAYGSMLCLVFHEKQILEMKFVIFQINACNGFYCDSFTPNQLYKPTMWTEAWSGWYVSLPFLFCWKSVLCKNVTNTL